MEKVLMKLKLRPSDLKTLEAHALEAFPHECCGLLLGHFRGDEIEAVEVVKAENVKRSPVTFEAAPEFVYHQYRRAEERGLELVGIYHSHPNIAAFVSSHDFKIMELWPGVAWLILSVAKDRVLERKAYALKNGKIEELKLLSS
ncbi:MAG: M67 family metallopeptidase [Candidatus Hodarchaeaceae archaeon]|nr:M67 family metallopeptidase [Candidatus Hodarchaeaceae archaeon]